MTAHPKTCPITGELHFFGYGSITRAVPDLPPGRRGGQFVVSRPIEVPGATMMHDFHLTAEHVGVHGPAGRLRPGDRVGRGLPYRWDAGYGARLGVLRRDDPYGEVRWFDDRPLLRLPHAQRVRRARTARIVAARRCATTTCGGPATTTPPASCGAGRSTWPTGTVREEQLDDRPAEFPRIDDRLAGPTRGSATSRPDRERPAPLRPARGHFGRHDFGAGRVPGEAVFVPAEHGEGWLLTYVYDAGGDRSDLVVLDAGDLAAAPVATVHLPQRVPAGFHGNWLPDA